MKKPNNHRARRTALATAVATAALWGSFGAAVHADDEPVAEPPVETGETGGATVAVGPPPVPPTAVVVAVAAPPVPPTSVVVAVAAPPVPPTAVVVAVGPPPVPPAQPATPQPPSAQPEAPETRRVHPQAVVGLRRPASVTDRFTEVLTDVIAQIEAAMALIHSQL